MNTPVSLISRVLCAGPMLLAVLSFGLCGAPRELHAASDPVPAAATNFVVEAFVQHVEAHDGYPQDMREFVRRTWEQRRGSDDLQQFIPEVLALVDPRFKAGLEACEAGEHQACIRQMSQLSLSADLYLATHAAYFQTQALAESLQLEYASLLLDYYFREDEEFSVGEYTLYVPDMHFLLGYCRFHTYEIADALAALQEFGQRYPAASPKLVKAAEEMLAASQPLPQKTLDQAEMLMTGAEGSLRDGLSGRDTQIQQYKALTILEALVCKAKQCEKKCCKKSGGCKKCNGGKQSKKGGRTSSTPAQQSTLMGGDGQGGDQRGAPRATPGQVWGEMRPAERAKVLQALQENFPSRYRDLVEQYFTELGKER